MFARWVHAGVASTTRCAIGCVCEAAGTAARPHLSIRDLVAAQLGSWLLQRRTKDSGIRARSSPTVCGSTTFALSLRDISEMMLERGVVVSHETIRQWCAKFGQDYANQLRRRRPRPGDKWHLDEVFIRIQRQATLPLAPRRPGRQRPRRPGPAPPKRRGRDEVLPAAPKGIAVRATRARHRQAGQLPGRASRGDAVGRAPAIEVPQ